MMTSLSVGGGGGSIGADLGDIEEKGEKGEKASRRGKEEKEREREGGAGLGRTVFGKWLCHGHDRSSSGPRNT
jgi:hypothetical protein